MAVDFIDSFNPEGKMKSMLLLISVGTLSFSSAYSAMVDPQTPPNALPFSGGSNWKLVFSDEFNGASLDTTKWGVDVSTSSRGARTTHGINDWWWKAANVSLNGSNLVLDVIKHDADTMYCGSVSSDGLFEPRYGYLEARIQIADTTKDTHTAFWMQGKNMSNVDGTGYDGAEVDIFESAWFADTTKAVVHIDGYGASKQANTKQFSVPGIHEGYHVFGLDWTTNSMTVYYDGVLKTTFTGIWVPQTNEWIWLSDGASFGDIGTFTNEPVGLLTSAKFDYVRVWETAPPVPQVNLTVLSEHGTPIPSGITTPASNSLVNASILDSPVINGTTQFVCIGWIGTGSLTSGLGTNTSFTITEDSTIAWQWQTNYWINFETTGQ